MMLSTYSQSIQLTPDQQTRIDTLFTPEKIIEYSKSISNELRQKDTITSLQNKIKTLKSINNKFYSSNQFALKKIDSLNLSIEKSNQAYQNGLKDLTGLFKKQLTKERIITVVVVVAAIVTILSIK